MLGGCATRGGPVPYAANGSFAAPDVPKAEIATAARVGPGDTLAIDVYRVPDLSREVTVDPLGKFEFPLIGTVEVNGLTSNDIEQTLARRLSERYLQSPQVTVTIKNSVSSRITVDGSVKQPGLYQIPPETSLIQAIALAKGPDEDANPRRVVVFRTINGQRQAAAFDLVNIRHGVEPDPTIYPRDIVIVDGSKARSRFRDLLSTIPLFALFRPF